MRLIILIERSKFVLNLNFYQSMDHVGPLELECSDVAKV